MLGGYRFEDMFKLPLTPKPLTVFRIMSVFPMYSCFLPRYNTSTCRGQQHSDPFIASTCRRTWTCNSHFLSAWHRKAAPGLQAPLSCHAGQDAVAESPSEAPGEGGSSGPAALSQGAQPGKGAARSCHRHS
ncbi:hypothetical protein Anapl_00497 [Anas platyrhynchos]|uniref:Uncharacterized protein n=1 Tax=Anas platyrhynchos TaxID=8839 RepID=R0L5T3_ANAPL|nr:hypothetical protein Anapl_00497 [Anas platyrhynchos]